MLCVFNFNQTCTPSVFQAKVPTKPNHVWPCPPSPLNYRQWGGGGFRWPVLGPATRFKKASGGGQACGTGHPVYHTVPQPLGSTPVRPQAVLRTLPRLDTPERVGEGGGGGPLLQLRLVWGLGGVHTQKSKIAQRNSIAFGKAPQGGGSDVEAEIALGKLKRTPTVAK